MFMGGISLNETGLNDFMKQPVSDFRGVFKKMLPPQISVCTSIVIWNGLFHETIHSYFRGRMFHKIPP